MLLLLLGALDLGRLFYAQITITNAAKEGVLVASRGGTYVASGACSSSNTVMCGVLTEASGGFVEVDQTKVIQNPAGNVVCPSSAVMGSAVSVTVDAPFRLITPFIGAVMGGQDMTISATAHAQCAVLPALALNPEPAPTPKVNCTVPSFVGDNANNNAQRANIAAKWSDADFVGALTFTGSGNSVTAQSLVAGSSQLCSSSISLTR